MYAYIEIPMVTLFPLSELSWWTMPWIAWCHSLISSLLSSCSSIIRVLAKMICPIQLINQSVNVSVCISICPYVCVCLYTCFSIIHQFVLYTPDHFKQHKVNCHALKGDSKCFVFDLKKKKKYLLMHDKVKLYTPKVYKWCICCGIIVSRVPGECAGDLPGSAGRKKSQHGHCSHFNLRRAASLCGSRGEWQRRAAGQRDAVLSCSVYRRPVWPVQALVM